MQVITLQGQGCMFAIFQAKQHAQGLRHCLGYAHAGQAIRQKLRRLDTGFAQQRVARAHVEACHHLTDAGEGQVNRMGHIAQVGQVEVQLLGTQMVQQIPRVVHLHTHVHTGVAVAGFNQQARQQCGSRVRPDAKGQITDQPLAVQADVALQAMVFEQQLAGALHHKGACVGASHFQGSAVKQLEAQLLFRRLHAAAESRLADVAQQGGPPKVACIGQGDQVFEAP